MIFLSDVIVFLRPNAKWALNGDIYEGLNWLDEIQAKPTQEELNQGYIDLQNKNTIDQMKQSKLNDLDKEYENAQRVQVLYGSLFLIPLTGDLFTVTIPNQVLEAQISGSASLIALDVNGNEQILKEVSFGRWKQFYKESKGFSFDNYVLRQTLFNQISACQTIQDLSAINVNVFPPIALIDLSDKNSK